MISKILLLLISLSFFVLASLISPQKEGIMTFSITKIFILFVSLLSFTIFFIKTQRFQDILKVRPVKKITLILFSIGSIFLLAMSFLLNGEDSNYVVDIALDPIAYFIQAKIFSTGHINVPSHELKEFFTTGYCINDGKYYSMYFPCWPLILSLGLIVGTPWIINPLIGLSTLLVIYLIGQEIYNKNTGLFAAVLLLFSSTFYVLTTILMSESSALFFSSLFFYLMIRTIKEPKILTSSLAGLSLGIAFLIRPYSAIAISIPIISYFLFYSLTNKRKTLIPFAVLVLTFLPGLFVFFIYNHFQTGSIFLTPMQYYNPFNTLGFGLRSIDVIIEPKPYTLFIGLRKLLFNLVQLNWVSVPFLFVFLFFVLIRKKNKWDIILFVTVLTIIFLHIFFHGQSNRYYYSSFFALFLLAARGMNLSDIVFTKIFFNKSVKNLNHFFLLFIVVANIFIVISPRKVIERYKLYRQLRDPFDIVARNNLNNSVVFLKSVPGRANNITYYVQNPLDFRGDVLFVRDLQERNKELMEYYPEKEFYIYEFDRESKSGKLTRLK